MYPIKFNIALRFVYFRLELIYLLTTLNAYETSFIFAFDVYFHKKYIYFKHFKGFPTQ